jgi:hypothetical protein
MSPSMGAPSVINLLSPGSCNGVAAGAPTQILPLRREAKVARRFLFPAGFFFRVRPFFRRWNVRPGAAPAAASSLVAAGAFSS